MTPLILGCDPGKSGALALVTAAGVLHDVIDMPDATGAALGAHLRDFLEAHSPNVVVCAWVEQVHAMPKQGVVSSFNFGANYGAILSALGALGVRTELVTPNVWKKAMRCTADKTLARQRACERWPESSGLFARAKDADRAEAALVAEYGRRTGL